MSRYFSFRAIAIGLVVLIVLYGMLLALFRAGLFTADSTVALVAAALVYACGGYVAGTVAGYRQVLNAFAVGLLFGSFTWLALRIFGSEAFNESSMSVDVAGGGIALFTVLACGIGGVVSVVTPFRPGRRS